MGINKLKIVISVLKELSDGNIPKASDYCIDKQEFYDIIEVMQDDNLIKNINILRGRQDNKVIAIKMNNVKITIRGMEYLNQNSTLVKTYKRLKEIRDWLPF